MAINALSYIGVNSNKIDDWSEYSQKCLGTPTYVANNKIFWGQDRFEFAIEEINSIS